MKIYTNKQNITLRFPKNDKMLNGRLIDSTHGKYKISIEGENFLFRPENIEVFPSEPNSKQVLKTVNIRYKMCSIHIC
jgi:hypothetical protein